MLRFNTIDVPFSKAFVSNGTLPAYIDPQQPPTRKKPFSTILNQPFTHTVDLVLPEELYDVIWQDISSKMRSIEYSRVIMSLSDIIDGDFFNKYIKAGDILMLSEGRLGIDDQYMLKDGHLRLDVAKETYERLGLVGKPLRDSGRKHVKTRYSVDIDLRQPSMLHGKKGFERIIWAFKNVLNHSVTWLFHDFGEKKLEETPKPIAKHHPLRYGVVARQTKTEAITVPSLDLRNATGSNADFEDWALDIYEWLGLISLESPRVKASDSIDPYLSRYRIPKAADIGSSKSCNMVALTWKALIPASWIRELFITLVARCGNFKSVPSAAFFALSAKAFKTEVEGQQDGYTILGLSDQHAATQTMEDGHQSKKQRRAERQGREFVEWVVCDNQA